MGICQTTERTDNRVKSLKSKDKFISLNNTGSKKKLECGRQSTTEKSLSRQLKNDENAAIKAEGCETEMINTGLSDFANTYKETSLKNEYREKNNKMKESLQLIKSQFESTVNLGNIPVTEVNYSSKKITKYFKDQIPYSGSELFTDALFPPNFNSILGLNDRGQPLDTDTERRSEAEQNFYINEKDVVWLRPDEIFGSEYALFEGQIEFDDVRQGSIKNSYFMASLSALTECPQIIAEIFRVLDIQKNGYYELCLKIDGEWSIIILDDFIPCSKATRKPIFAKPKGNELWAILLEKAWAKVNGGYINTVAGMASEVFECMTNFPFEFFQTTLANNDENYKADLWKKILEASDNDYIMTISLPVNREAKSVGLIDGLEYSLEYGREVEINNENHKLLKLRNPWGNINYKGKWGERSDKWTPELKPALDYKNVYDGEGEFYISYDDLLYYFGDIDICKIEKRLCLRQFCINYSDPCTFKIVEVNIDQSSKLNITIFKPHFRFNKGLPTYWSLNQHLLLAKAEDLKNFNFSKFWGASEGQHDCCLDVELEPGKYFLLAYVDPSSAKTENSPIKKELIESLKTFINVGCSNLFSMQVQATDSDLFLLHQMILSYNRNNPSSPTKQTIITAQDNFVNSEISFLYLKNIYKYSIEFTFDFNNVEVKGIYKDLNHYRFRLQPYEDTVFLFTCKDIYTGHGIGYTFKLKKANDESPTVKLIPDSILLHETINNETNLEEYLWLYRKSNIDYSKILVQIDSTDASFKHLHAYFPKEIEEILKIPKLKDHQSLQLIVKTKECFGENNWYIGEWKLSENDELVMWGRGYLFLNGDIYIGQFINNSMTGAGSMIKQNGEKIEGMFIDYRPIGKCALTHTDGKVEIYQYLNTI